MAGRKNKNNLLSEIFETAVYAVLGVVIAVIIYNALIIILGTNRPLIDVVSDSMVPAINRGDLVLVKHVEPEDIKIGDVIVFDTLSQSLPVIHRVYKINSDGTYQTLGDNNRGEQHEWEKTIEYKDVVGESMLVIPYVGWIKIASCAAFPQVCNILAPPR
jgi:signal peptidase I